MCRIFSLRSRKTTSRPPSACITRQTRPASSTCRSCQRSNKKSQTEKLAVVADFEGDVGDHFEVDGRAGFGGRLEFPLSEGGFGVGVELRIKAPRNLDAVDGAVGVNNGVEDDFALHVLLDEIRRVLWIDFSYWHGHG